MSDNLRRDLATGCEESRLLLSRRSMLGVTAGLFSWACAPKLASAATLDPRLLVVVLRGGMDGLAAVPPYGEGSVYVEGRGELYIRPDALIRLADKKHTNFFGLHPALRSFGQMYAAGDASIVHATSTPLWTRSHFDCQDNLENGMPPAVVANPTGWLNRLLRALPSGEPVRQRGAIEIGSAPLILRGSEPVLGWSASTLEHVADPTLYLIRTLYKSRDKVFSDNLERGLEAQRFAEGLGATPDDVTDLQMGFLGAGRLLASPVGPRIATLSVNGWDTHTDQGAVDGELADRLAELDDGLSLFRTSVGDAWSQTVVMIVTEFGRMVANNGNHGSDHGVGTVALLAGGAVKGGRIFSKWPGLAPTQLLDKRDLKATIDLRSVFKGVLREHLDVPDSIVNATVFPDSGSAKPLKGLIKGA
ncbi:DUF1501 domain-containing protein [Chenggangzhangella methanolivorans]|uniref:DUF1501 domain-containing protein n=1 Tax=Chenggangzhangella methanolivorans TaxID=1437009 RepID=A0A9E6UKU9_9HYPH|nr:DUF1501 domain-containing protein [Chenggangzhangella methanolivorans]QZN99821.1 DUF1501 domain-containing protein [Chenggangzhangella methanolivorans]